MYECVVEVLVGIQQIRNKTSTTGRVELESNICGAYRMQAGWRETMKGLEKLTRAVDAVRRVGV